MKYFTTLLLLLLLSACGGSGGNSGGTTASTTLNTTDVLADPGADFKTFQYVDLIAANDSDLNVTLYIYDNLQTLVARRYIESNAETTISIQIPTADQVVSLQWHYREQVKKDEVNLADIETFSFSGF